jgi:hypothetical protein
MSRFIRMPVAATAAGGLALLGLITAGAASASTTTQGSWTLTAPGTSSSTESAQVLQPINSNGSSIFSNKSRTIPVQWQVNKTTTSGFKFESVVSGDSGATPSSDTAYSVASFPMPSGVTVADISNLTANFNWAYGENHSGGFRWQVNVMYNGQPKNIMVDYGDASTTMQTGTAGSGVNMVNSPTANENRDESTQVGGIQYTPWSYVVSNFGNLPVTGVDLVVDGGWGTGLTAGTQDQVINLNTATVGWTGLSAGNSTFTMPGTTTTTVQDNSQPAWLYLYKNSSATPAAQIDENLLTSTQGDSGGQYRQVDSKYIYNMPVSNLPDPTASYSVGISFNSNGSNPIAQVGFGVK